MDYAAAANQIHEKLNKLGLSLDPRHYLTATNYLRINSIDPFSETIYPCKLILKGRYLEATYTITVPSWRFIIVSWLLFGGKLTIKKGTKE